MPAVAGQGPACHLWLVREDGRPGQGRRRRRMGAGVVRHRRPAGGRRPRGRGRRPAGQRPRPVPPGVQLLLDRALPDRPLRRPRAPVGALEAAAGLLGQGGRPGPGARGAGRSPVRGHDPARLLLPGPRRRPPRAAAAGGHEQRQRRPWPAGQPVPARDPVPARLGGGADPGGRRHGRPARRRPRPGRPDRGQPGRLLGAAGAGLQAPLRGRGGRPRGGRRVHLLDRAAPGLHAGPAPGPVQEGRLRHRETRWPRSPPRC
jgi:hypothetical protein